MKTLSACPPLSARRTVILDDECQSACVWGCMRSDQIGSDAQVDERAVYELTLTSDGGESSTFTIRGSTFRCLLECWRKEETARGERMSFNDFFAIALDRVNDRLKRRSV